MVLDLAKATALILALGLLQGLNARAGRHAPRLATVSSGLIFGGMCVIGMMMPIRLDDGVIFDARSAVLSMAGLFGGLWVGIIAGAIAGVYRWHLGGAGMVVGLLVISASVLLGLGFRVLKEQRQWSLHFGHLLAFGVVVHLVALLFFTQLPAPYSTTVLRDLGLPYLLILAPATALLGLLLQALENHQRTENALAASEARLRAISAASPDISLVIDEEGRILELIAPDPNALYGRPEEMRNRKLEQIFSDEQSAHFLRFVRRTLQQDEPSTLQYQLDTPRGLRHYEARARAIDVPLQGKRAVLTLVRDVTERLQAEEELRIAARAFESQQGMVITDADNHILRVNSAFTRITGYTQEDVAGQSTRLLSSGQHDSGFYRAMWAQIQDQGSWEGEVWNRRRNGALYPARLTVTAVTSATGNVTHYVGALQDLTQSKLAEEEIHSLAFFDHLTALPNRRLLTDRLRTALMNCDLNHESGALLFIDLDDFKNVNDLLSHQNGDLMLQQVAQRLRSLTEPDHTAARFGADEFVVLLQHLPADPVAARLQAENLGQNILNSLNRPFMLGQHFRQIGASIGIVLFANGQSRIDDLLLQADLAMHEAKRLGKNRLHYFDPVMQQQVTARLQLEDDIRAGIDRQEFTLYFQPQIDHTGRICGAEALARWPHTRRGLVPPGEFIPAAEAAGLMPQLGRLLLRQLCHQLACWQHDDIMANVPIAINLSATQIYEAGFVDHLLELLTETRAPASLLTLEITESLLLTDIDDARDIAQRLRGHGIRMSIDDFGTGYSSLAYLQRLPLNELKIDKSFVQHLTDNPNNVAIVQMIVALAGALKLTVIAEGVESTTQRDALLRQGCQHFQGYLYARPLPPETFLNWVRQHVERQPAADSHAQTPPGAES